ncbi:unnamed protein product [Protopolystoma xenopodis]|uniref:Uncharacterized protein n=1 Tax=Protopolystoma xenopodis TaxID=117903 RepID=A0A448WCK0_9PLAT|nr:unnamed protein product [Protopolystoma xenopodis]
MGGQGECRKRPITMPTWNSPPSPNLIFNSSQSDAACPDPTAWDLRVSDKRLPCDTGLDSSSRKVVLSLNDCVDRKSQSTNFDDRKPFAAATSVEMVKTLPAAGPELIPKLASPQPQQPSPDSRSTITVEQGVETTETTEGLERSVRMMFAPSGNQSGKLEGGRATADGISALTPRQELQGDPNPDEPSLGHFVSHANM